MTTVNTDSSTTVAVSTGTDHEPSSFQFVHVLPRDLMIIIEYSARTPVHGLIVGGTSEDVNSFLVVKLLPPSSLASSFTPDSDCGNVGAVTRISGSSTDQSKPMVTHWCRRGLRLRLRLQQRLVAWSKRSNNGAVVW